MKNQREINEIKALVKSKGVTAYDIAKNTTLTEAGIGKILNGVTKSPHLTTVREILNYLHNYEGDKTGKAEKGNETEAGDEIKRNSPSLTKEKGVPYYDVDFYGGFDFAFNDQTIQPAFLIDYAPYNDCDAWINVTGKSMSPFISHGDIAALKKLNNWQEFIPFGEVYAVLTEEHKTIKIVTAGKDEDHLTLVPYNKSREFVEQQIPKRIIHQMYRVKGSLKKFF